MRGESGALVPDPNGRPFRQWRPEIQSPDDIWDEIVTSAAIPGATQPSKLQPIAARLVMLQSGIRAPMGVKIQGPDLQTIERVGLRIEELLKKVPGVDPQTVFADRIVGKPYLEIEIDRKAIARYGLQIMDVQNVIEVAVGGRRITTTVEGRERYPVRVRYLRELRDQVETLERILVSTSEGSQIPLKQIAQINYVRGPMSIRSEDTFLVGYVLFDKQDGYAEVDVVEAASTYLDYLRDTGELVLPQRVSYTFAGNYENQLHAVRTLNVVRPVALLIIFVLLYLQFRRISTSLFVFSVIFLAWSGGFLLIWLYNQPGFLDVVLFGVNLREVFQIHPINLSVAVWVGFLALFGIASDDGVVMATYIKQTLDRERPKTVADIRSAVIEAGTRRIRPCLMTTATTLLALLPVLTSQGRGADLMIPMAIPVFGGMVLELITPFLIPVLYSAAEELRLKFPQTNPNPNP
jgi:Cu(I)/Ag(I) efflux system membrane protein CusA/SilA